LIILDVDCFKALNDSEGHQRGDEYLTLVGSELQRLARREVDVAARYGGEEFALILPETDEGGAMRVAESVREAIAGLGLPHLASSVAAFLTVSAGVSTAIRESCCTPDDLISAADQALYRAKRNGRNRTEFAEREDLVPRHASSSENCFR
jgi:diguanylate cyclase (GGDEF)-like protein